ncbi:radical SAM protein [Candidatus Bathyarchaeota archaeon]|nr:radical SAM protein [Candidatus Bathyarchaeota archaeon]
MKLGSAFLAYRIGKPRLTYAVYCCTARCNLRCGFCDWWKKKGPELSTREALRVIADLVDFGICVLDFSGGEPTLRKDLSVLASEARDFGVFTILSTNGTLFDAERAKELSKSFDVVNVSLDGFREQHDASRGVPGAYERAMKGLKFLSERKEAKIGIDLTITRRNLHEIMPLFKQLYGFIDFVSFQPILPYPAPEGLALKPQEALNLAEDLLAMKREDPSYVAPLEGYIHLLKYYFSPKYPRICDAGVLYAMVDPKGLILACNLCGKSVIGDLTQSSINELWYSEARERAIEATSSCLGCLSQCTTMVSLAHRGKVSLLDIKGAFKLKG